MFNQSIKQKLIIVGLGFIALILFIIISILKNRVTPPTITATSYLPPTVNQKEQVLINFSNEVSAADFTLSSKPSEVWQILNTQPSQLSLTSNLNLIPNTTYTFSLLWQDRSLPPQTITTPTSNANYRNNQNLQQQMDQKYPLLNESPYETSSFRAVYSAPMTLEITLKSNSLSEQEAISQVKSWVEKNGGDPAAHHYQVISSSPTPNPTESPTSP